MQVGDYGIASIYEDYSPFTQWKVGTITKVIHKDSQNWYQLDNDNVCYDLFTELTAEEGTNVETAYNDILAGNITLDYEAFPTTPIFEQYK